MTEKKKSGGVFRYVGIHILMGIGLVIAIVYSLFKILIGGGPSKDKEEEKDE